MIVIVNLSVGVYGTALRTDWVTVLLQHLIKILVQFLAVTLDKQTACDFWDHFQRLTQGSKWPFSVNSTYFFLFVVTESASKRKKSWLFRARQVNGSESPILSFLQEDCGKDCRDISRKTYSKLMVQNLHLIFFYLLEAI